MSEAASTDAFYAAIGRWMVEFSQLVLFMRWPVELRLARGVAVIEPKIVMGEATADQVSNAFFELCSHVAKPDDSERKVLARLKEEVKDQTKRRNDFAHGDWLGAPHDLALFRTKPGRKGTAWTMKRPSPAEIEGWSSALSLLSKTVGEVGNLCLNPDMMEGVWGKPVRLGDIYVYQPGDGGKRGQKPGGRRAEVLREGPLAEQFGGIFRL